MRDEVPDSGDNTDEADVEDILGRGFYVTLVNAAYGLKAANKLAASKPKDVPVRVALEVSDRFKTMPANGGRVRPHYAPAAYLGMHPDAVSGPHLNEALERFEGLFRELNSLLQSVRQSWWSSPAVVVAPGW